MKSVKTVVFTSLMVLASIFSISCKDGNKKEAAAPMSNEMHQEEVNNSGKVAGSDAQNSKAAFLREYLSIKNALVADNSDEASEIAGGKLIAALESFDLSEYTATEQTKLKAIIVDANKQAEHIADSPIETQRKHFKNLTKNITDIVAITGKDKTLYQQFCPMYDGGSVWLSASNNVKNPYYGSKMLNCGSVQKEIN